MLKLIEEEEDDDYGILLGMAAVEGERLAIESRGPRRGGSLPGHAVSVRDRVEGKDEEEISSFREIQNPRGLIRQENGSQLNEGKKDF
ncbi:hypothetical protein LWI28_001290 [Acer negundo]|uniref:Uncharacterized protein n=1 Tax=Acer negundo TaxID=4023 RepID=A0AAD5NER9_ACENE|nr:hypothetical protein LWI28_001290 [Acer negundo]